MSVIFAIEDILFHELWHLASLRVWVAVVVAAGQSGTGNKSGKWLWLSAHPDLDREGCARFLLVLKEKNLVNNDLQKEKDSGEGEEPSES